MIPKPLRIREVILDSDNWRCKAEMRQGPVTTGECTDQLWEGCFLHGKVWALFLGLLTPQNKLGIKNFCDIFLLKPWICQTLFIL